MGTLLNAYIVVIDIIVDVTVTVVVDIVQACYMSENYYLYQYQETQELVRVEDYCWWEDYIAGVKYHVYYLMYHIILF